MRILLSMALILALATPFPGREADKEVVPPFALKVVPSQSTTEGGTIVLDGADVFHVVLTNVSKESCSVFEAWNSWGYQNISFEFTTDDGTKTTVRRAPASFKRNFSSTYIIAPGEHYIYTIHLNIADDKDGQWMVEPPPTKALTPITLQAIYSVEPCGKSTAHGVWTGLVKSAPYKLTLRWRH